MRIADTSVLYALFSRDDIHHADAVQGMKRPEPILIPSEIWSETISLIHYRQGFESAARCGEALMDLPHVEFTASTMDIVRDSWKNFLKAGGELSLADCTVLVWCRKARANPLSFDEKIVSRAGNSGRPR